MNTEEEEEEEWKWKNNKMMKNTNEIKSAINAFTNKHNREKQQHTITKFMCTWKYLPNFFTIYYIHTLWEGKRSKSLFN